MKTPWTKTKGFVFRTLCLLILVFIFGAFIWAPSGFIQKKYQLDPASELYIQGSSNINNFTCYCNEKFEKKTLSAEVLSQGKEIKFHKTILELPVLSLDCGKKRMNSDMYETLKSEEFPIIFVELKRAFRKETTLMSLNTEWTEFKAEAIITIAGVPQNVDLLISGKKEANGKLRFISNKDLKMSQFGLEAPKALLGIIKVHDCLTINFDLTVVVEEFS